MLQHKGYNRPLQQNLRAYKLFHATQKCYPVKRGGGGLHIYIYFPCIVMGHVPVMGHVSGTRNVLYMTRVQHENGCPHSCNMLIFCGKTILFSVIGDLDQRSLVIWPCWGVYFPFCRTSPLEQWPTYLPLGTACPV